MMELTREQLKKEYDEVVSKLIDIFDDRVHSILTTGIDPAGEEFMDLVCREVELQRYSSILNGSNMGQRRIPNRATKVLPIPRSVLNSKRMTGKNSGKSAQRWSKNWNG